MASLTLVAKSPKARRAARLVGGATADQVLSALSNLVVTVAVARSLGLDGLGKFSFAIAAYLAAMGFSRSLISEPLLAQPRGTDERHAEAASVTLTLLFAGLAGIISTGTGVVLHRPELVAVAGALPITLLQDVLRYHALRRQRTEIAVVLDGGWLVGAVCVLPLIGHFGSASMAIALWAAAAAVGVAFGCRALSPRLLGPCLAVRWWREHARALSGPLTVESGIVTASTQSLMFVLGSLGGNAALGLLRAGQVYFGPLGMLFTAVGVTAVPWLARRSGSLTAALANMCAAALAAGAALGCAAILVFAPLLHEVLYADSIQIPVSVMLPLACQVVLGAWAGGYVIVAKVEQRGNRIAMSRLVAVLVGLATLVPATVRYGVQGAAWNLALQALLYAALLGIFAARTRRTDDANGDQGGHGSHGYHQP